MLISLENTAKFDMMGWRNIYLHGVIIWSFVKQNIVFNVAKIFSGQLKLTCIIQFMNHVSLDRESLDCVSWNSDNLLKAHTSFKHMMRDIMAIVYNII